MAGAGEVLVARGTVARVGERGRHRMIELDVLIAAGACPILQVRHVALWQLGVAPGPATVGGSAVGGLSGLGAVAGPGEGTRT